MFRVFLIHPDHLDDSWQCAEKFILAALSRNHGEHGIEDLKAGAATGAMRLWVVMDDGCCVGAAVTAVTSWPGAKALQVLYLGGEQMIEWYQVFDEQIEGYARAAGCQMIQFLGRKGWARAAASLGGYEQQYVVIGKRIE